MSLIATVVGVGATCAAAYGLTWTARWLAPRLGCVDHPDGGRKLHARATPLLGGVAVLAALWFGAAVWPSSLLAAPVMEGLVVSSVAMCLVGAWDDRYGMRAHYKFLGQLLAIAPFLACLTHHPHALEFMGYAIPMNGGWWFWIALWLVAVVNLINLADGSDGAACAVVGIALISLMAMAPSDSSLWILCALLLASVLGFLVHNLPPAKIFLGDAGSLTLGFLVGALILLTLTDDRSRFHVAPALTLLFIPAWDTLLAVARRMLQGKSIGEGDRDHIHHLMRNLGLSAPWTLLALVLLHVTVAVAAVASFRLGWDLIGVTSAALVAVALIASGVFGRSEIRLASQAWRIWRMRRSAAATLSGGEQAFARLPGVEPSRAPSGKSKAA